MPRTYDPSSLPPHEALRRLYDGNHRFRLTGGPSAGRPWSRDLATEAQRPFAIVLGCSDARTPVEILFDQGFGDLFVVRVAGNTASASVVGSIEFAVAQFGTRLVVVMGHTHCGAVEATVRVLETGQGSDSKNVRAITERIAPHVHGRIRPPLTDEERKRIVREAVRTNVRAAADHLRNGSDFLEEIVAAGRLLVVGAEYELETATVHFFDGVPDGVLPASAAPSIDAPSPAQGP